MPLYEGDTGDGELARAIIAKHKVDAIIHFAASIVVPDSVADPLGYYKNNTANSRTLIEAAVNAGVKYFIFSSTAAVYGNPQTVPVAEDAPLDPMSPYGSSKLMTEIILRDTGLAHPLKYAILRYFNVAGADPQMRTGQSTPAATHLIKVAVQAALGMRKKMDVFGTDYPTPDGTCIRDYIHVTDLVRAHSDALAYLRAGGDSSTFNCGYGRGFSVLRGDRHRQARVGRGFPRRSRGSAGRAIRRESWRPPTAHARCCGWTPRYDDLPTIVSDALQWEQKLRTRNT